MRRGHLGGWSRCIQRMLRIALAFLFPALTSSPSILPSHEVGNFHYQRLLSITELTVQAALDNGISPSLPLAITWAESRDNPKASVRQRSNGVVYSGIFQMSPTLACKLGVDPMDPWQAIPASVKYLAHLQSAGGLARCKWQHGEWSRVCR